MANGRRTQTAISGGEVFEYIIEQRMNVGSAEQELAMLRTLEKSAVDSFLATGTWDILMLQDPEKLPVLLTLHTQHFFERSKYKRAARAAEKMMQIEFADSSQLYDAARILSKCAASFQKNEGQELTELQLQNREAWIENALELLKKSIDAGWNDFERMKNDTDLEVLRLLPRFKAMVISNDSEDAS